MKHIALKVRRGFTLIELLVVIAIISILATVVFVALDPVTRFADARDSRRWNDVNTILTAIQQYIVDNDGALPAGLATSQAATELGTCGVTCDNLATPLAPYLASIPIDPGDNAVNTGYTVAVSANNIITVAAPDAENGTVQVSR